MLLDYDPNSSHALIQPRIAAVLCCQNNLMTLSWHMAISKEPFRYAVAIRDENTTHDMLYQHKSFTLNFLPFPYYEEIDACGRVHGNEVEKLTFSGLTSAQSDPFGNIILDGSDYVYECTVIDTYQNGDHTVFVADVGQIHINSCFDGHPTLFLGRGRYATITPAEQIKQNGVKGPL